MIKSMNAWPAALVPVFNAPLPAHPSARQAIKAESP
jgi:hypothetical protein